MYDDTVIIYSVLKWFQFFTVWLIAGTVNIIRLYDDVVIIYSVFHDRYFLQCGWLLERSTSPSVRCRSYHLQCIWMVSIFYSVADCWNGEHHPLVRWHCGRGHFECAEWDSIPDGFGPRYCAWANRHHLQPADTGQKKYFYKLKKMSVFKLYSFLRYTVFSYILQKYSVVDNCSVLYNYILFAFLFTKLSTL